MKVKSLISVEFTKEELKEALLLSLDCKANNLIEGSLENIRCREIIDHIKKETHVSMDWHDDVFCLSPDGIAKTEKF